jgi:hypothetical protein
MNTNTGGKPQITRTRLHRCREAFLRAGCTDVVAGIGDPGLAFASGINDAGYSDLRLFDGIILFL